MEGKVVNIYKEEFDVYIGRANPRLNLPESPFYNPFHIGKDGSRDDVCDKYEERLREHPDLIKRVRKELKGKVLGCYCAPLRCHGDLLRFIANCTEEQFQRWLAYSKSK